eukprot:TRINITY_DN26511_c0_g1_i1.p1 TRINITY_DN26511_c0_g1~~TRINITY_DN26511_c0_g1_i1.p1  ORF type:complete len:407 (+),score=87.59 TRINITY_DN26511_c0_g1_i1:123-1343(+)
MASALLSGQFAAVLKLPTDDLVAEACRDKNLGNAFVGGSQSLSSSSASLSGSRLTVHSRVAVSERRRSGIVASAHFDHIPKQFRRENLKEGLEANFKNVPSSMYGLSPSQMDMFMNEDNPVSRQTQMVTEETISSAHYYKDGTGMWSADGLEAGRAAGNKSRLSMSVSMYRGGGGFGRPKQAPPDLPSLLLDARICYIGMPIVPAVTELVIAEMLWLDYDNPQKPIYVYINSPGTQNEKRESIGFETEAYAIADSINFMKAPVFTVNCGQALGQAAMLLAIGNKGKRAVQPNSVTKLYSPKVGQSGGSATDMWIKAKELDANTAYYVELLAKGTGKSEEEIARDIQRPRYFHGQEAIDYGLADTIIQSRGVAMEKKNYDQLLAQSRAMRSQYARPAAAAAGAGAGR